MASQVSVQNLEEAASVAAEYISTLENLPYEIAHLLAEIKHKEMKSQELHSEIQRETAKFAKQVLKNTESPLQSKPDKDAPASKEKLSAKLKTTYAQIEVLSTEKIALGQTVAEKIQRARGRLDHDLKKVITLQGGPALDDLIVPGPVLLGRTGQNPVQIIQQSLRNAYAPPEYIPASPSMGHSLSSVPANKRRRIGASASMATIKIPSPAPTGGYNTSFAGRPRRAAMNIDMDEEDAEGEEDLDDEIEGIGEDTTPYCFCQKPSFGEMIGCDGQECRYQWFHVGCLNIKPPLPEVFYCPECIQKLPASNSNKKNRRK